MEDNHILATKVPPNMTKLYQPLDLSVNKAAKDFTRKTFSEWYTRQLTNGMENGIELDDIKIDYRLRVLKPLHATWVISLYNHMNSPEGKAVSASGWKKSGIFDTIMTGSSKLPTLDPFDDICPLIGVIPERETLSLASLLPKELESYKRLLTEDKNDIASDDSEWEVDVDEDTNDDIEVDGSVIFDLFEN